MIVIVASIKIYNKYTYVHDNEISVFMRGQYEQLKCGIQDAGENYNFIFNFIDVPKDISLSQLYEKIDREQAYGIQKMIFVGFDELKLPKRYKKLDLYMLDDNFETHSIHGYHKEKLKEMIQKHFLYQHVELLYQQPLTNSEKKHQDELKMLLKEMNISYQEKNINNYQDQYPAIVFQQSVIKKQSLKQYQSPICIFGPYQEAFDLIETCDNIHMIYFNEYYLGYNSVLSFVTHQDNSKINEYIYIHQKNLYDFHYADLLFR